MNVHDTGANAKRPDQIGFKDVLNNAIHKNRIRVEREKTLERYDVAWYHWDLDCEIAMRHFHEPPDVMGKGFSNDENDHASAASLKLAKDLVEIADCLNLLSRSSYPRLAVESYQDRESSLEGHSGEILNRSSVVVLAAIADVIENPGRAETVARELLESSSELNLACGQFAKLVIDPASEGNRDEPDASENFNRVASDCQDDERSDGQPSICEPSRALASAEASKEDSESPTTANAREAGRPGERKRGRPSAVSSDDRIATWDRWKRAYDAGTSKADFLLDEEIDFTFLESCRQASSRKSKKAKRTKSD